MTVFGTGKQSLGLAPRRPAIPIAPLHPPAIPIAPLQSQARSCATCPARLRSRPRRPRPLAHPPPLPLADRGSDSPSCPDLPGLDRLHEGGVVGFGLIGIGNRESSYRAIEAVGVAAIAVQNRGVARAGVRLGEHLSANPCVFLQREAVQLFRVDRSLVVRELAYEVVAARQRRPAEEWI